MDEIIYDYQPPVSKLLTLGDPRKQIRRTDFHKIGLTDAHTPELVQMLQDEDLHWADSEGVEVWAPLHAWRALGALRAESAIEPLIALLPRIDEYDDDWVMEDLPDTFAEIGEAAAPALGLFLADNRQGLWARITAASSLGKIGEKHPEAHDICVAALTSVLHHYKQQDADLNGFIISALVDLNAVEAAELMGQAFAAGKAEESIIGDWEDIQIRLGLLDKRITPEPHYVSIPLAPGFDAEKRDRIESQKKGEVQSRRQAKAKTRAKNKQASKQRKQQRKKKKK